MLVLNEKSLPFKNESECRLGLEKFFNIIHLAKSKGVEFSNAEGVSTWNALNFLDGFSLEKWLNTADKDLSRRVKSALANIPCPVVDFEDITAPLPFDDYIFTLLDDDVMDLRGVGYAYLNDLSSISFQSDEKWCVSGLTVVKYWCDGDADQEEVKCVGNVFSLENSNEIISEILSRRHAKKQYLEMLTIDNNPGYKCLSFSESALKNFCSNVVTTENISEIAGVLRKLDEGIAVSKNLEELNKETGLRITGESNATMEKYSARRMFKHPVLGRSSFEYHVKNFTSSRRMHIQIDYNLKSICVGYFGRHLPTVSDPT